MTDSLNSIKPCPFCGGTASVGPVYDCHPTNPQYIVGCSECGIEFKRKRKRDAIAAWNRRADANQHS